MNIELKNTEFVDVDKIEIPEIFNRRFKTDIEVVDQLFGGSGFLPGSTFTLAGGPGSGKSTFLMQMLSILAAKGKNVAYISGEENVYQISFNARRLGIKGVKVCNLTDLDTICDKILEHKFDFVVIDSFPTVQVNRKNVSSKKREEMVVNTLCSLAKKNDIVMGFVLHVTKQGKYKGSTLLPHTTDMNIMLSKPEEIEDARNIHTREFHATKNRFGFCSFITLNMAQNGFVFKAAEKHDPFKGKKKITTQEGVEKFGSYYKAIKYFSANGYVSKGKGKNKHFVRK
jgi:predicted ATP-dependent serine protease